MAMSPGSGVAPLISLQVRQEATGGPARSALGVPIIVLVRPFVQAALQVCS